MRYSSTAAEFPKNSVQKMPKPLNVSVLRQKHRSLLEKGGK